MNEMEIYLKSTEAINSDHKTIQEAAKKLTLGCASREISKIWGVEKESMAKRRGF
jgi:hypothetical protein